MSKVSVPKVMLATIGIHLSADSLRRVLAQLVKNAASYIQQEKVQQHPHQSRKATIMTIKRERERRPIRKRAKQNKKAPSHAIRPCCVCVGIRDMHFIIHNFYFFRNVKLSINEPSSKENLKDE